MRCGKILARYPGLQSEVVTFLGDRISESLTGETADIAVKVFGDQLDTLDATGRRIAQALRGTPGIADLQFKPQSGTPTLRCRYSRRRWSPTGSRCRTCWMRCKPNMPAPRWARPMPAPASSMSSCCCRKPRATGPSFCPR